MKVINSIACILFVLFISSCTSENAVKEEKEVLKVSLEGKVILPEEIKGRVMTRVDNLLFFYQTGGEGDVFKIYDLDNNYKLVGAYGTFGDGPEEYLAPRITDKEKVGNDYILTIYDRFKNKVSAVSLNAIINNSEDKVVNRFSIDPKHSMNQDFLKIDEQTYVATPGMEATNRGRIHIYDESTQEFSHNDMIPKVAVYDNMESYEKYALYMTKLAKHPSKDKIVSIMFSFDRLDFYSSKGEHLQEVLGPEYESEFARVNMDGNSDNAKFFYLDVSVSENLIYTLYLNETLETYITQDISDVGIKIYDWDGDQLAEISIPNFLTSIEIDEERGKIYGIAPSEEKILEYDISEVLKQIK